MQQGRMKIYKAGWHLAATFGILATPLVFLFLFSKFAGIEIVRLFRDIALSSVRLFAAYGIAVVFGWLFAVLFYRGKRSVVALPLFDVLQSFPTFAALPLAAAIWGATNGTVIFFLVITIIWPIFFSVLSSLKLIQHDWKDAATILRMDRMTYFRKFLWPVTVPGLMTGTIVGLGEGWEALVATEMVVRMQGGLGSFFQAFSGDLPITALGILGLLLLIFSMNKLVWLPLLERSHRRMGE